MTLQTRRMTYEEYLKSPEIKQRYEIVDGKMIMAPGPTGGHQRLLRQTFKMLDQFVIEHQLGEILFAPLDVLIQREPLRTRQPDLMFVSNEKSGIVGQIVEGAPDLVVEILSPSNTRAAMEAKLADYSQLGVRECWLISPEARSVEVLELSQGNWQRLSMYGLGDQVQSNVLPGLALPVAEIFG
ncbi:MAG TPA: Uma2 family endonuclease [Dehalococcoidia bacterium]|nr:Uma2 family endonuclease [Dehalococcoidia bacterium]